MPPPDKSTNTAGLENAILAVAQAFSQWTGTVIQTNADGAYVIIGDLLICFAKKQASSTGTYFNFPKAFAAAPTITVNLNDPGAQDARAYNISTAGCTLRQSYSASTLEVQYIAIGRVG